MHQIDIKGVVVSNDDYRFYEWLDIEAVCPRVVNEEIEKASGKPLEIHISSPGGNVIAGSEIYVALKNYKKGVTVKITGLAASAASVIAMAGDEVLIAPTAQIMIHNSSSVASGNRSEMKHMAEVLEGTDFTIANAYVLKSGIPHKTFLDLMEKETWFGPEKAMEYGLVDGILFGDTAKENAQRKLDQLKNKVVGK